MGGNGTEIHTHNGQGIREVRIFDFYEVEKFKVMS